MRTGPATMADFATDLAALLDRLEIARAHVVGLSIGGLIAQELYRVRPDLVVSLILSDTAHRIGTLESWNTRISKVETSGIEAIADGIMQVWFSRGYHEKCPDAIAGWRAMLTRTPLDGYLTACRAIRDADLTETAKTDQSPDALCRRRRGRFDACRFGARAINRSFPAPGLRSSWGRVICPALKSRMFYAVSSTRM